MKIEQVSIGFLFSEDSKYVSLMKRNFPEFDNEILLTGIGGHVDEDESYGEAMVREFKEEAGLLIDSWKPFAYLQRGTSLQVNFYKAFSDKIFEITNKEKDMARFYPVEQLHIFKSYPNVKYLVYSALDHLLISVNLIQ